MAFALYGPRRDAVLHGILQPKLCSEGTLSRCISLHKCQRKHCVPHYCIVRPWNLSSPSSSLTQPGQRRADMPDHLMVRAATSARPSVLAVLLASPRQESEMWMRWQLAGFVMAGSW